MFGSRGKETGRRRLGRFSGGQLTLIIVAVVVVVGFPISAFATYTVSNVSITDPHGTYRAYVNSAGQLDTYTKGAVGNATPPHPFALAGARGAGTTDTRIRCATSPCRIAITDIVISQINNDSSRLNVVIALYQDGGAGTCASTTGPPILKVLPYAFIPADTTTTINFTTPLVTTSSLVCLSIATGANAGLSLGYTISGYWES
ncbi:MAG TPA: hypothetical protein VGP92_10765 [Acidimicrobiia bacterium]|jgi:hypothetical protein|nr:hypothetical protein [Acidimicrobiia bacterium]